MDPRSADEIEIGRACPRASAGRDAGAVDLHGDSGDAGAAPGIAEGADRGDRHRPCPEAVGELVASHASTIVVATGWGRQFWRQAGFLPAPPGIRISEADPRVGVNPSPGRYHLGMNQRLSYCWLS